MRSARAFQRAGLLAVVLLSGCATVIGHTRDPNEQGNGASGLYAAGTVLLYQDSVGPLSYRSVSGGAAPSRAVNGVACQSAITIPFGLIWAVAQSGSPANAAGFLGAGWGDGGYAKAVAAAQAAAPGSRLTDVRADLRTRIVLGIWRQQCVQIAATAVPG